jgi:hypothetical protein
MKQNNTRRRIYLVAGLIYESKARRPRIDHTRNKETQREKIRIDKLVFKMKSVSQAKDNACGTKYGIGGKYLQKKL